MAIVSAIQKRCTASQVTGKLASFEGLVGNRPSFVVAVRPVWGWAISDAIREHEEALLETRKHALKGR